MLDPAVIVMDVNLPKMDGIAATREIKTRYPDIVVIGLTFRIEDYIVYAMLKAGAFHVVAKDNLVTDLYRTIQQAVAAAHPVVVLAETIVNPKPTEDSSQLPLPDATSGARKSPA
jgi:DNA-binding NarL/FixJ family response regulator